MRRQQEYLIDKNEGYASRQFMEQALRSYKPGMLDQMSQTWQQHMSMGTVPFARDTLMREQGSQETIPLDMWNQENTPYFRKGINWHENLTNTDARILSERHDRDAEFQLNMGNTDPFALHNIGAALGAAAFDPLSYIPFVGPAAKIATGARTAYQLARIGKHTADIGKISMQGVMGGMTATLATRTIAEVSRLSKVISPVKATFKGILSPFKPVATYSMEGMLAESAYQTIKHMSDARAEEDIDYMGGVFDVMIAGIFGGVLGTLPMAINFRRNFKKEQLHQALAKSMDTWGDQGFVAIDGSGTDAQFRVSDVEATANNKADVDGFETVSLEEIKKQAHPIQSFLEEGFGDLKTGMKNVIGAYRRCSS
jgi:hypothetical protein